MMKLISAGNKITIPIEIIISVKDRNGKPITLFETKINIPKNMGTKSIFMLACGFSSHIFMSGVLLYNTEWTITYALNWEGIKEQLGERYEESQNLLIQELAIFLGLPSICNLNGPDAMYQFFLESSDTH